MSRDKSITLQVPLALRGKVRHEAAAEMTSEAAIIRRALAKYFGVKQRRETSR